MSKGHHEHDKGHSGGPAPEGMTPHRGHPHGADSTSTTTTLVPSAEFEAMKTQLAEKEKELAELKDKYLRTLADHENSRKRIRQQAEESGRLQKETLLRELLPVVDNLERALDAARGAGTGDAIVQGVEMVLRSLLDYLKGHGVTPVDAVGLPFDPARHEAADHVESPSHPPNTVIKEFHRGYQVGDRVLRPARVTVAKGPNAGGRIGGESRSVDVEKN
jgi:molecular chaperone GrpE